MNAVHVNVVRGSDDWRDRQSDPDWGKAKSLGFVFGVAFPVMPITRQASAFLALLLRTVARAIHVTEAWLWVMDPRGVMDPYVLQVEESKPLPEGVLSGVRSVRGWTG